MAEDNKIITSYNDSFVALKKNIVTTTLEENIKSTDTTNETLMYNYYTNIKTDINSLTGIYSDLALKKNSIIDTFMQLCIYAAYHATLNNESMTFKKEVSFINNIFSEDSTLMLLLKKIKETYRLYKNEVELYKLYGKKEDYILKNNLLNQLKNYISQFNDCAKELLTALNVIPNDAVYDAQTNTISSPLIQSLSIADNKNYYLLSGTVDKTGYIAQKAEVFVYGENNDTIYVSCPLLKISNNKFDYTRDGSDIWGLIEFYDYIANVVVDNAASDTNTNNDDIIFSYTFNTYKLRFGNIFNADKLDSTKESESFKISVENDAWSNGNINAKGNAVSKSITINFKKDNANDISTNIHFSDKAEVFRTIEYNSITYNIYGTLTYDKELSEENNKKYDDYYKKIDELKKKIEEKYSNDENECTNQLNAIDDISNKYKLYFKKATYYTGKLYIKESTADTADNTDTDSSKDVVLVLSPNSSGYDIECYLDPNSTLNSTTSVNKTNKSLLLKVFSNINYTNMTLTHNLIINDAYTKAALTLMQIGHSGILDFNNNFELLLSNLTKYLNDLYNSFTVALLNQISLMNDIISSATLISNILSSNDIYYTSDYTSDISSLFSTIQSEFQTYLSSDSYSVTELYDGTFINKIDSSILDINDKLSELFLDISKSEALLYNTELKLLTIVNKKKITTSYKDIADLFYNTLTGTNEYLVNATNLTNFISFNIDYSYNKWIIGVNNNINYLYNFNTNAIKLNAYTFNNELNIIYIADEIQKILNNIDHTEDFAYIKYIQNFENALKLRLAKLYNNDAALRTCMDGKLLKAINSIPTSMFEYNLNDNSYFVRPQLTQNLPYSELINNLEIEDSMHSEHTAAYKNQLIACKNIMRYSISQIPYNQISSILNNEVKLFNKINIFNFREKIFYYSFLLVCSEIKAFSTTENSVLANLVSKSDIELALNNISTTENEIINYMLLKKLIKEQNKNLLIFPNYYINTNSEDTPYVQI